MHLLKDSVGEEYVKRSFDSISRPAQIQLSTFGFSNNLASDLLQDLAIRGGGIFGFIPDQSMIGTIFINYMANTFLTMAQDVLIDVGANYELNRRDSPKTCLQYGKERHYLVRLNEGARSDRFVLSLGFEAGSMVEVRLKEDSASSEKALETYRIQLAKYKMLELVLNSSLPQVKIDSFVNSEEIKSVPSFWYELAQEANGNDQNKEQIRLSLKFWKTWGAHYMRFDLIFFQVQFKR